MEPQTNNMFFEEHFADQAKITTLDQAGHRRPAGDNYLGHGTPGPFSKYELEHNFLAFNVCRELLSQAVGTSMRDLVSI